MHGLCWGGAFFFACGQHQSAEQLEQERLEAAWKAQQQAVNTAVDPSAISTEAPAEIPLADVPMSLMLDYDNLSPLMQGYFGDASSVKKLTTGLRRDPNPLTAPVILRVRWIPMELNRGKGEIAVVYDKPVESLNQLQPVANALLDYRNHVGGAFDMRLLSFSMYIEGQGVAGCRIPLLNKSGLNYGLLSPCVSVKDEKWCVDKDGQISQNMRTALDLCFIE